MQDDAVSLKFREGQRAPETRRAFDIADFTLERVLIDGSQSFDYDWRGSRHYLALHDIDINDGETVLDGATVSQGGELRDRITFAPKDCRVQGWSDLGVGNHGYIALFFAPGLAESERERPLLGSEPDPMVYFQDPALHRTLRRLQQLVDGADGFDAVAGETLCLTAALQLYPVVGFTRTESRGRLTLQQQCRIRDYIADSMEQPISLSILASLTGMSRFHFARSFRETFGLPPHQYLLRRRIALAADLLSRTTMPITLIGQRVGFSAPARFSTAFRRTMGCSPRSFRDRVA